MDVPMEQWILQLDYQVLKLINQTWASPWQDDFFPWITDLNKSRVFGWCLLPILLFFFYRKYKRVGISLCLMLILAVTFNDYIGAQVKRHYQRPRPFQNLEIEAKQRSPADSKSFYSNHTSNMFTFATYTSAFFPAAQVPLFMLASIIGYSRIYNGVHYPTDVLAGAIMGLIWGSFFASLARRWLGRKKKDST